MPTEVVRSIGTGAGRDYASIQAWIDAAPASLVTDDVVWIGELYNDSLYSFSGNFSGGFSFGTKATDATRYFWMRAASGHSFRDKPGPLTRPSVERGVFIQSTQTNAVLINRSSNQKLVLTGLQLEQTQRSGRFETGINDIVDSCVVFGTGAIPCITSTTTNCLLVHLVDSIVTTSVQDNFDSAPIGTIQNCTIVSLQPRSFMTLNNSGGKRLKFKNCLFAGYTTGALPSASVFISNADCANNYGSMQAFPGINNRVGGLQFPFPSLNDFRPIALPELAISPTSQNCTKDIYGRPRQSVSYYGCVEGVPVPIYRGRKKAYVPGYRITAPSRIQTGSARTIDGTDTESLTRGLVGAWCPSLGASGFRLIDRSGNGNHGTLTNMDPGTDWVPSGGKLALDFDGVNDFVNISSIPTALTEITISGWFQVSGNANLIQALRPSSLNTMFYANVVGSNNLRMFIGEGKLAGEGGSFGAYRFYTSTSSVSLNSWVHYAGTFKLANESFQMFLNGSAISSNLNSGGGTISSIGFGTTPLYFGRIDSTYGASQQDDIRIYNRALTPSEIRLLYTGGRGVGLLPEAKPKRARIVAWDNRDKISVPARVLTHTDSLKRGLVGHWSPSVSGPQGNRLMDLSGQNNHGTLTNMDYQTDYVPSTDKGGRMALDFDGSDDRISLQNAVITRTATCSLWIKPRASNFVAIGSISGNYFLYYDGTSIYYSAQSSFVSVAYTFPAAWTFFTVTRSSRVITFFINGVQVGTQQIISGDVDMTVDSIGSYNNSTFPANAQLDDVRIYNRALTPSEIRLLAQSRMPERATPQRTRTVFYSSGLVSYLRRRTYNSILGSGVLS